MALYYLNQADYNGQYRYFNTETDKYEVNPNPPTQAILVDTFNSLRLVAGPNPQTGVYDYEITATGTILRTPTIIPTSVAQVPPPFSAEIPVFQENEINKSKLVGPADDDNSYDKKDAASNASQENDATAAGSDNTDNVQNAFAGATTAGKAQGNTPATKAVTNKSVGTGPKPGTRLQNPLGNFATYTYQISMYMITPDAYNAFVASGRKNINALTSSANGKTSGGGAFLIAQSGGINNSTSKRAPGFDLDYYIDDLKIKTATSGKSTQTSSNTTDLSFNIYEPFGFSLVTKLKDAFNSLKNTSKIPNYDKAPNASKQFFILGIRFQGYDKNGNIANASTTFSDDTFNQSPDASGVYERFYDITVKTFKFKINGAATTYNLTAAVTPTSVGLGMARGTVDVMVPITAGTVEEALTGEGDGITSLFATLNATQKSLVDNNKIEIANKYSVRFAGNSDKIKNASLVSKADTDKKKIAMSRATSSAQVNDATGQGSVPDSSRKLITIPGDTPIPQAIKKIIMQSSFLESAMTVIYDANDEPNADGSPEQVVKKDPPPVQWYNLSTELKILGFDTKVGDFAYDITYVVQPYETPAASSPYTTSSSYYGPHKRYDYWFTGKNSEIISYEQTMDNTFFTVALAPSETGASQTGGASVASMPNKRQNQDRQGRDGVGNEAQNSYMTSLFDPGAYAEAKLTILGDPDYLSQETPSSLNEVYNQFYGTDGYTINANGGQVFIEINFNEAIDYKNSTGLLDVNQNILFWEYPQSVANKIKGVSYMVKEVESTFSKGKFTQNLSCVINDFPKEQLASTSASSDTGRQPTNTPTSSDVRTGNNNTSSSGNPTPTAGAATSSKTGLTQDPAVAVSPSTTTEASQTNLAANPAPIPTVPETTVVATNNGPVADGENDVAGSTQAGAADSNSDNGGRETYAEEYNGRSDYYNET